MKLEECSVDLHRHPILCARCKRVHDLDDDAYHKHPNERCYHCGMLMETERCCRDDCIPDHLMIRPTRGDHVVR